jgi:hypothetical protein
MTKENDDKKDKNKEGKRGGYGNPPEDKRFQPGDVGNPKGRPKGSKNFKTLVQNALRSTVKMKRDGKLKNVSSQEAALLTLLERALVKKDLKAIQTVLEYGRLYNDEEPTAEGAVLSDQEESLLKAFAERHSTEELEDDEGEGNDDGCENS